MQSIVHGRLFMSKQSTSVKNRKQRQNIRVKERNIYGKAANWAGKIGIIVCLVLIFIEYHYSGSFTYGLWTLYSLVYGIIWFVLGAKTGKRQNYLYGALLTICDVLFFISSMRG